MTGAGSLVDLLDESCRRYPHRLAVVVPNGERIAYARLSALSDRVRDRLRHLGVLPGDRVGLVLHKSVGGVALILGILKARAAYVPVDADAPAGRAAYILENCRVKVVVTERGLEVNLLQKLQEIGASPMVLTVENGCAAASLDELLTRLQCSYPVPAVASEASEDSDLAYILYTSGSTGNPKGVMLTHGSAQSFVDWCSRSFAPTVDDRFSSHAPFHFDLSIFDIFVSIKHAATLVLIDEDLGKEPMRLASVISSERITIWYSTPSILGLLSRYGKLKRYDFSGLRLVLFAGEVFPVRQYCDLRALWRDPRFFNLYGPTETNVCTWFEIPSDDLVTEMSSFPIGRMCAPNVGMVADEEGKPLKAGGAGELLVSGPNVMMGYWELPEYDARVFLVDSKGQKWYRTGDIVTEGPDGFLYLGRRDRMVKRRGYRVELGEIEAALLRDDSVQEAAVVAVTDVENGVRITAFVSGPQTRELCTNALKAIAMRGLPRYMIPDRFVVVDAVPRTSTDKINYEELKRRATSDH
jgi:amino acid adenylation domain-containing protein